VRLLFLFYVFPAGTWVGKYWELGLRLRGVVGPLPAPFFSSPWYVSLTALLQAAGFGPLDVRLGQCLVGAANCVLIWWAGRFFFRENVSRLASAVSVVYFPLVLYDCTLLPATWAIFFNLWALGFAGRWLGSRRHRDLWGAGIWLGLSIVTRPNALLFALGTAAFVFWKGRGALPRRLGRGLIPLLGALAAVVPVTLWNVLAGSAPVPVTASGGWVFYCANNPNANGFAYAPPPGLDELAISYYASPGEKLGYTEHLFSQVLASRNAGRSLSAAEASAYWFARGREYISENPGAYLLLLGRKLAAALNRYEPHDLPEVIERAAAGARLPALGILFPLALSGFFLHRARNTALPRIYLGAYFFSFLILYVTPRYRLAAVPVLVLFAAGFAVDLAACFRRRDARGVALGLIAVALFTGLSWARIPDLEEDRCCKRPAFLAEWRGLTDLRNGDWARAELHFQEALRLFPDSGRARMGLEAARRNRN